MRRTDACGVLLVVVAAAAFLLASSLASARSVTGARSVAGPTFAGVWNSDFGQLTLGAGGSGSYTGFNPGTVSGSVKGSVDKGTWHQPGTPPKDGTFEFTLSADGLTFTGTWAYTSGGCGTACGWNGSCLSGPCLQNAQAPPSTTTTTEQTTTTGPISTSGTCPTVIHGRRLQSTAALKEVRVLCVVGDVQFHREGEPTDTWHQLEKDAVLHAGDEISTDPDGSTVLAFADNSTVRVGYTTQLKIASFFAEGGIVRTQILLKMGEVSATVNKTETTKSDFKIKSPTGVSSVRGTVFAVFYDPGSNVSLTSVTRGVVTVDPAKAGLATTEVTVGKEVEVTATTISPLAAIGKAGARGGDDRFRAGILVMKLVGSKTVACKLVTPRTNAFSVKPTTGGWTVATKAIAGKARGTSIWHVTGPKVVAQNADAKKIAAGCP